MAPETDIDLEALADRDDEEFHGAERSDFEDEDERCSKWRTPSSKKTIAPRVWRRFISFLISEAKSRSFTEKKAIIKEMIRIISMLKSMSIIPNPFPTFDPKSIRYPLRLFVHA